MASLIVVAILACAEPLVWQQAQGQTVTYDALMQTAVDERLTTFNAITAANRASLVREQISRWRKNTLSG